ncbi:MAG: peptidoglycan DD-metalloendopeptidase family protein, partial [Burkholderiales bacterium]|nr:peptidoglycan DD-metalloendopeptidase family protein [Burkholderiales bacterium]
MLAPAVWAAEKAPSQEELRQLRGRIDALKQELARTEGSRSEAADALRESEQAISDANRRLFELGQDKRRADVRRAELRSETRTIEQGIGKQRALAAAMLRGEYTAGRAGPVRLLFEGSDPNEIARRMAYHGYLARARALVVERLAADQRRLEQLAAEALQRTQEIAAIQGEELAGRRRLETEKEKRRAVLAGIARQIERQQREIGTLQSDERRLTRLAESLARMLVARKPPPPPTTTIDRVPDASFDGTPFQQLKGRLQLPVRGELSGRFGSPRADGGLTWRGLFIQSTAGQEVRAVAAGQVVYADWLRGFGNLLILDHGDGYMSLYGNNESLLRRVGERVRGGDAVATVGSSGGNATAGLYFELRHQGRPFDPLGWVP